MVTDRNGNTIRYGKINTRMVGAWARLAPEDDGPFWALNLMKYRDVASYADGREGKRSGREADDEYTPRESLAAIGADIVFAGDVVDIPIGDGVAWDRVGIVRYPSRRAFLAMQQRDDFKSKHVHKDAGMEFTIVMSCLPVLPFGGSDARAPYVEVTVAAAEGPASANTGTFDVEGVIVGDERTWRTASFRALHDAPESGESRKADDTYVIVVRPMVDRLTVSVRAANS